MVLKIYVKNYFLVKRSLAGLKVICNSYLQDPGVILIVKSRYTRGPLMLLCGGSSLIYVTLACH